MNIDRNITTSTSPSGTSTSPSGTVVCHAVPCHISYTGPSSGVDVFFNPIEIGNDGPRTNTGVSNHESSDSKTLTKSKSSYQASMIRGRGLLARSNAGNDTVCGHVFQVVTEASSPTTMLTSRHDSNTDVSSSSHFPQQQKYVQLIQSFDRYVEWYHEHQTSMIPSPTDSNTRYNRAMEWINTADCLHVPIPISAESSKEKFRK